MNELQTLLLRAALDPPPAALAAWDRARPELGELTELSWATRALLPQVYRNLTAAGADEERMDELRAHHRLVVFRNHRLFRAGAEAVRALQDGGIDVLLFKGSAMSALWYGEAGARSMTDVDLLVRPEDAAAATGILAASGWTAKPGDRRATEIEMRFRHSRTYRRPPDIEVDLHWWPLHEPVDVAAFWEGAVAARLAGVETLALNAADQLLVTCIHGLYGESGAARWVIDAALLMRGAGSALDWSRLTERAEALHLTVGVEHSLRLLSDDFGLAIPAAVLERLRAARSPLFERVAHRVRVRPPRRGATVAQQWSSYRRLRRLQPQAAGTSFPAYLRDLTNADSWRELVPRYKRTRGAGPA